MYITGAVKFPTLWLSGITAQPLQSGPKIIFSGIFTNKTIIFVIYCPFIFNHTFTLNIQSVISLKAFFTSHYFCKQGFRKNKEFIL